VYGATDTPLLKRRSSREKAGFSDVPTLPVIDVAAIVDSA
jgi:hypothetical protein